MWETERKKTASSKKGYNSYPDRSATMSRAARMQPLEVTDIFRISELPGLQCPHNSLENVLKIVIIFLLNTVIVT